jgi:DNA-directed RNA polymerase specialized sigma24 family protein
MGGRLFSHVIRFGADRDRAARSVAAIMDRDNETWLTQLSSAGPDQQVALSDLRAALLRGLRRALSQRAGADDGFLEDVVQDALVRILERLPQFEGRSQFTTWAMAVAIRVAMSALRRRRWKDVSLDEAVANADLAHGRVVLDGPARSSVRSARRSSPRCTR